MPTIHVELFEGRTLEQKREYAKALTEATVKTLKVPASYADQFYGLRGHISFVRQKLEESIKRG